MRLCVYGYWISGNVELRLDEHRFYIDGYRMYPPMYDPEPKCAVSAELLDNHRETNIRRECKLFWHDLDRAGRRPSEIAERLAALAGRFPGVLNCDVDSDGDVTVIFESGTDVRFNARRPVQDAEGNDAYLSQGEAIAEDMYYDFLYRIGRECIYIQTGEKSIGVCKNSTSYETVLDEIEEARAAVEPIRPEKWGNGNVLSWLDAEMIREPWWVFRE